MGFKLRSGNGPLAFKNMGSSPAKGWGDIFGGANKQANEMAKQTPKINTIEIDESKNERVKLGSSRPNGEDAVTKTTDKKGEVKTKAFKNDASEPAADPNKGKHKDQIKKQAKLDKITARRERKGKEGLTDRQMKLKEQTNKTGEEYMADKTAKKDADRRRASEIMIGISKNFDPNSQFKSLAEQEAQSSTTKRRNQNIEDYETGKNKELELDNEPSNKTNTDGTAKIAKSTAQKVDDEEAVKAGTKVKNSDGTYSPSSPAEYKRKK